MIDFHKNIADRILTVTNETMAMKNNIIVKKDEGVTQ